jgi:hypothetical protein
MNSVISSSKKFIYPLVVILLLGTACANVQQINRGRLASRIMQLNPIPNKQAFLDEFHSIREGADGGKGKSAGGGCGCN